MLPRPGRAHDQLLRSIVVAAIGGLAIGHILWLIAISVATATTNVNRWVLVVSAIFAVLSVAAVLLGSRFYQRRSQVWAAFLLCLPISPILLTIAVLGVTYL
jgi:hypothetical protein